MLLSTRMQVALCTAANLVFGAVVCAQSVDVMEMPIPLKPPAQRKKEDPPVQGVAVARAGTNLCKAVVSRLVVYGGVAVVMTAMGVRATKNAEEEIPLERPAPKDMETTLRLIDTILVWRHPRIPGVYNCEEFARDYEKQANQKGIPTWQMKFGCPVKNYQMLLGYKPFLHKLDVIEVAYPYSKTFRKFCVVEPQGNSDIIACWVAEQPNPIPEYVRLKLREAHGTDGFDDKAVAKWGEFYKVLGVE